MKLMEHCFLGERVVLVKKQNKKINFIYKIDYKKDWWGQPTLKFVEYIINNPDIIPDEGFYLIKTSERIKSINFSDWLDTEIFNILETNNIKIGVSTRRNEDSCNIITIPNYFILIDSEKYHNYQITQNYNWDTKKNKLIYMGTVNSEFRKNITDNLKNKNFSDFFLRNNNNISTIEYEMNEHGKYKFILDLPTDHKYNYDYSWTIWKKFYFKSLIFHILLPDSHHNYLYDFLKDGQDWILCKDGQDLEEKYNYYNTHLEEAKIIAENGFNKMLSIVKNYKTIYKNYLKKCKNDLNLLKLLNN